MTSLPETALILLPAVLYGAFLAWSLYNGSCRQPRIFHFFAFGCLISAVANASGYLPVKQAASYVFLYAAPSHAFDAALLFLVGSGSIFLGMWGVEHLGIRGRPDNRSYVFQGHGMFVALHVAAAVLFFGKSLIPLKLGIPGSFLFNWVPLGVLFYAGLQLHEVSGRRWWPLTVLLVLAFTAYNVLNAYLRYEMLMPSVALGLGIVLSSELSGKSFLQPALWPLYAWLVVFSLFFPWMKENRGDYGVGWNRSAYCIIPAKVNTQFRSK